MVVGFRGFLWEICRLDLMKVFFFFSFMLLVFLVVVEESKRYLVIRVEVCGFRRFLFVLFNSGVGVEF